MSDLNPITARSLSKHESITVSLGDHTRMLSKPLASAVTMKGAFNLSAAVHGQGFESLGRTPTSLFSQYYRGINLRGYRDFFVNGLVIKRPGSYDHKLPVELADLMLVVQTAAIHEFRADAGMKDKLGFLTYRVSTLKDDVPQIAQEQWHIHRPLSLEAMQARKDVLGLAHESFMWAGRIDSDGIQSEYIVSNIAGTLIQTAPAIEPLPLSLRDNAYVTPQPAFDYRQAEPLEIVHGNSYTFHAAAKPKPEEIGQRRAFVLMTYAPLTP